MFAVPGPYAFNVNEPPNPYPWEFPPTPRLRTIPLSPVGLHYDEGGSSDGDRGNGGSGEGDDNPSEEHNTTRVTKGSMSLGTAKPTNRENNSQHQVSSIFTPLEIMLYIYGLDSSPAVRFRREGAATTALRTIRGRNNASSSSARCWEFPRRRGNF